VGSKKTQQVEKGRGDETIKKALAKEKNENKNGSSGKKKKGLQGVEGF